MGLEIPPEQVPIVNAFIQQGLASRAKVRVIEHKGFVSIYDKWITFENIEALAKRLSSAIHGQVLFSSVFDDNLFLFGLCSDGETVAYHASGDCEIHGMECANYCLDCLIAYSSSNGTVTPEMQEQSGIELEKTLVESLGFALDSK